MDQNDNPLQLSIFRPLPFSGGCLEVRLFYVRIVPCALDSPPDHLILRHLRREFGVFLEVNGARIPSSDAVSISLRRDRVDKDSSEVTYVATDSVKIWGPLEFEVLHDSTLILCGSLQRAAAAAAAAAAAWTNGSAGSDTGWDMDCYAAMANRPSSSATGISSSSPPPPSIEVYVAGCCSGMPVILTKTVLLSPRRKVSSQAQGMLLDAIPEDEEMMGNGLIRQRKLQYALSLVDGVLLGLG
ncbi:uncharacterized protein At1g01500-like isoform X2 [Andrographis paniculata]|uniref:uncharacterized protein At1g01500-like isoform X2 n=1 Tax=Andrographis paniculata TaxID=175694 RepID=UPI0021E75DF6|nr:uncharacterized protein At1g01500-like isoform X2 [Andrographis paniculata]